MKKIRTNFRKSGKISLIFLTLAIILFSISAASAATHLIGNNPADALTSSGVLVDSDITVEGIFEGIGNVNITIDRDVNITGTNPSNPAIINGEGISWLFNNTDGHNVRFENIKFVNAVAGITISGYTFGGVIYSNTGGTLIFINCIFENNTATYGGAIYVNNGDATIDGCTFTNNTASNGGAIFVNNGDATIDGCTFTNNTAYDGGAIYASNGDATIDGCTFTNNTATNRGGAIYASSDVTIDGCTFTNNTADTGGAIYVSGDLTVIDDCTFTNNTADTGGAIYALGSDVSIDGCTFTNNTASTYGGAIRLAASDMTIESSTFQSNTAGTSGGAISQTGTSTLTINQNPITQSDLEDSATWNYNALQTAINAANALNSADYTPVSWTALQNALTPAVTMNTNRDAVNQGQIDALTSALNTAIGSLVLVGSPVLDYTALQAAITDANSKIQSDYTVASWSAMQSALTPAVNMNIARNAVNQPQIDVLTSALNTAINNLVLVTNPNAPNTPTIPGTPGTSTPTSPSSPGTSIPTISSTHGTPGASFDYDKDLVRFITVLRGLNLNKAKFSVASWNNLIVAYSNARDIAIGKKANSQIEINNAAKALYVAAKGLSRRDADLGIANVRSSGNRYRITITNSGSDPSTTTRLLMCTGNRRYQKTAYVRPIAPGRSITITGNFYSNTKRYNRYIVINPSILATETNYRNNIVKIPKFTG